MGGFLSGFMGPITEKLQEVHKADQKKKDELRKIETEMILKSIDQNTTPAQAQVYHDKLNELYGKSKPGKEILGKVKVVLDKIQGHAQGPQGQAPQASQAPQAPQASQPQGQGQSPAASKLPPPEFSWGETISKAAKAPGQALDAAEARRLHTFQQKEEILQRGAQELEKIREKGREQRARPVIFKGIEREGYPGTWTKSLYSDSSIQWEKEGAKPSNARTTVIAANVTTLDHAKELAKSGKKFLDAEDDQPIDLEKAPQGMVLQAVELPGGKTRYSLRDQNSKFIKIGNVWYAVAPQLGEQLPQGAGTALGPGSAPSSSTHESRGIDTATGQPVVDTLRSTHVPSAPGIPGRSSAPSAPGATTAPPSSPGGTPGAKSKAPTAAPVTSTTPPPSSPGFRNVHGMQSGAYNQQRTIARAIGEGTTQVFGDKAQPQMKSLIDFADLADSKETRERVGELLRLTFDGMEAEESAHGGPSAGAQVGPVSVSTGGMGTWFQNLIGLPAAIARQKVERMEKVFAEVVKHPRELEYYNSMIASFTAIGGFRRATGQASSQYNTRALERDLPVLGQYVPNSQTYYDKLQHLAGLGFNGIKGIDRRIVDQDSPGTYERIKNLPKEIQALRESKGPGAKKLGEDQIHDGWIYHRDKPGETWKPVRKAE